MASKRRSYRGTPAQHQADAISRAKQTRDMARRARAQANAGHCIEALHQLIHAADVEGRYKQSRFYSAKASTILPRRVSGILDSAVDAFARKCLR